MIDDMEISLTQLQSAYQILDNYVSIILKQISDTVTELENPYRS